jgi:hypothetical protein
MNAPGLQILARAANGALFIVNSAAAQTQYASPQATANRDSAAGFEAIVPVLRHAGCNCHSKGDYPRQGDDSYRHTMHVRR